MIELYDFIVKISRGMIIKKTPIWSFVYYCIDDKSQYKMIGFIALISSSI